MLIGVFTATTSLSLSYMTVLPIAVEAPSEAPSVEIVRLASSCRQTLIKIQGEEAEGDILTNYNQNNLSLRVNDVNFKDDSSSTDRLTPDIQFPTAKISRWVMSSPKSTDKPDGFVKPSWLLDGGWKYSVRGGWNGRTS